MHAPRPEFDAVCVGLNVVDILVRLPATVTRGGKHEVSDLVVMGGAPAGNAACVLAALGARTAFLGHFGHNTLSAVAREDFARCGVLPDYYLDTPSARPGVAAVEIDPANGDRTVFYNLADYRWLAAADLPPDFGRRTRLVLCDGYDAVGAEAALLAARDAGAHRVLDLEAGDPVVLRRLLALATDAILPLAGATLLTGLTDPATALRALQSLTTAQLVITDGTRGSWAILPSGEVLHQACFPVVAVDTTGCGDAFHGAYSFALLQGWSLTSRLEFASWVASRVALQLGGRAQLPSRATLRATDRSVFSPALQFSLARILA